MKKLSLWNKFSKYIHKSFQKWPLLVQVGSKAQQPPRSPILGHFGDENTVQATALRGPRGSPARKTYHLEGNCKFRRTRVSTSASYDPPKTTSPRLANRSFFLRSTVSISVVKVSTVRWIAVNFRVDKIKSESKQTHHPGATVVHGYVK